MNITDRLRELWSELPMAHRAVMASAMAVVVLAGAGFVQWISTPSYTVLYAGMESADIAQVIEELESLGADYQLDGTTVMVPRSRVFDLRARLAGAGIAGSATPVGYELLDGEGLSVSDFKQQVDLKRATEGEWARTISKFDGVRSATVHIVIPEDELFREATEPAKATVVVDPSRSLAPHEVDTIVNTIAGGVDGLSSADVTVVDTAGNTLNMPDAAGGTFGTTSRNLQATRAYEAAAASNAMRQLEAIYGIGRSSVTVNAVLDFDQISTEQETYDPESAISLREQTVDETYTGEGSPPGGAVGVGGGAASTDGSTSNYERSEQTREFGVDRTIVRSVSAPGTLKRLSVAVTVDDGTLSGATVPDAEDVEALVAAAVGLDTSRDSIRVLSHPFPAVVDEEPAVAANMDSLMAMVPQVLGGLTLIIAAVALFGMSRSGKEQDEITWLPAPAPQPIVGGGAYAPSQPAVAAPQPVLAGVGAPAGLPTGAAANAGGHQGSGVNQLTQRQPDEVAQLLRSWLSEGGDQ